ncbi:exported hypothetical protein [Verrucomicrobia bacterium]|nr:exported hypothetical protein [Verrucomicrobiota bacterium]
MSRARPRRGSERYSTVVAGPGLSSGPYSAVTGVMDSRPWLRAGSRQPWVGGKPAGSCRQISCNRFRPTAL